MTNHPNRSKQRPAANPQPADIRAARKAAGMTQTEAGAMVYVGLTCWARWEAGERQMHPAFWELWRHKAAVEPPVPVKFPLS